VPAGRVSPRNAPRDALPVPRNRPGAWLRALPARMFAPVDIASLVLFRIAFGAIMLWEVVDYFRHDWIRQYFITPAFHFTYYGFDWVRPWPGALMYGHFLALGVLAAPSKKTSPPSANSEYW